MSFKTGVLCSCSNRPSDAMLWTKVVEMVESVDDLKTSQSIGRRRFLNSDATKIALALKKIIIKPRLKKEFSLEEQKAQMEDLFLRGRQIASMIYECFRVTGAHEAVLDYSDLFSITLHSNDIQDFDTRWDQVLLSTSEVPSGSILECVHKMRRRESVQLRTVLAMCEREISQNQSKPSNQKLKTMEKKHTDQKCRQDTHSQNTFVQVQVIRTLPAQMLHSPREHAWLKGQQDSRIALSSLCA